MTDIATVWNNLAGHGDWQVAGPDLLANQDLATAILISLFSDARLPDGDAPADGSQDPRGWWADTYTGDPIGSLLWTLKRAAIGDPDAFLVKAKDICDQALAWLLTDGVAASVTVNTFWLGGIIGNLAIGIGIVEPAGTSHYFQFAPVWAQLAGNA